MVGEKKVQDLSRLQDQIVEGLYTRVTLLDRVLCRMKALLEQQGLAAALEELPATVIVAYDNVIRKKAYNALILCLGDRVLREITKETTMAKLYTFNMHLGKSQSEHIDEFHKLVGDLTAINTTILDKDQALLLLTYLPSSYDSFVETLLYGWDTLKLEDVLATLNFRKLQKMMEAKGGGGKGLYVRGRSDQRDMEQGTYSAWSKSQGRRRRLRCYICQSEEHLKKDCPRECHVRGTCKVQVQMRDGSSFVLDNEVNGEKL
nr:retrovirus-related Pol polyprotein from transposon TNT 1-94 [Tanacetum cinerariifolium]